MMNWPLFINSLLVGALTTFSSVVLGVVAATFVLAVAPRLQRVLLGGAITALALPPLLVTNCWLHYLGLNGVWRVWLPVNLYSVAGTVLILTLLTWPLVMGAAFVSWSRLQHAHLEAYPEELRGWRLFHWVLWPMACRTVAAAAVLVFVLSINNFTVPALLQVKVFPAEMWIKYNTELNAGAALLEIWPLILAPLAALFMLGRAELSWPRQGRQATAGIVRRRLGPAWFYASAVAMGCLMVLSVVLPGVQLFGATGTFSELGGVWTAMPGVIANSALFAAASGLACVIAGLASWRAPLGLASWLPLLAPGIVLGLVLSWMFNRPWLETVYTGWPIIVVGWTIRYFGIGWNAVAHGLGSTDSVLMDVARVEGLTGWWFFRHVTWPQAGPWICAGWYMIYLLCLWDVETLVLIYPPGGETLALRIFNLLHYGHTPQVNALCLTLLGMAVAPLLFFLIARRSTGFLLCLPYIAVLALTGCERPPFQSCFFSEVQVVGSRGTGPGQFSKPRSMAVDREDNLYVTDMTGRVQKFSPGGEFLVSWQMPQTDLGKAKGMCRDNQGRVVVVEPHYSRVNHFSTGGVLQQQWGTHGTNVGQLAFPRAVAVDSAGGIFVSEYGLVERVQRFDSSGKICRGSFGERGSGPGQFNRPEGLATDQADRVYVADSCNHRIQIFSGDGQWLRSYGGPGTGPGRMSYPYDVQVDAQGNQIICEFGNSRLQVFDGNDRLVEVLGGPGSALGQFNNPWSIALDSRGNLYVADSGNHRVLRLVRKPIGSTIVRADKPRP